MRISSITKNAGKACNNRLYRHIRTFEKIVKNYFVIYTKTKSAGFERRFLMKRIGEKWKIEALQERLDGWQRIGL